MPKFATLALKAAMKALKPQMGKIDLEHQRAMQDKAVQLCKPGRPTRYLPVEVAGMKAAWEGPARGAPEDRAVLYCHGGAYLYGSLEYARVIAAKIALAAGLNVMAIEYPLAPEHPYPQALEAAVAAYRHLLELGFQPGQIALAGESAGGNMVLELLLRLKSLGIPLPAAAVTLSPWCDLGGRGASYRARAEQDATLDPDSIDDAARMYAAGVSLDDPLVSPAFGDFTGCPPVLIQCGSDEILYSDCLNLYRRMRDQGVDVVMQTWNELWHVFQCYPIAEAKAAIAEIARFLRRQLNLPAHRSRAAARPFRVMHRP